MDKLIKKIDSLQPEHHFVDSYEGEPGYDGGWNAAIGAVGDLLDSEMVWKDQPDSGEGRYWYRENVINDTIPSKRPIMCLEVFKPPLGQLSVILDDKVRFVKNLQGEWQRAIMPKS